jgi:hypothetical protein
MIERYFSQAKVRSGPGGPYVTRFVSALEDSRFSRDSIRRTRSPELVSRA